jgi:mono/diheme cytochrome c family protein
MIRVVLDTNILISALLSSQGPPAQVFLMTISPGATAFSGDEGTRYSDEQLYALALYISSLKPPPNPNPVDDRSRRGQQIFQQQGCAGCHTHRFTPATNSRQPWASRFLRIFSRAKRS